MMHWLVYAFIVIFGAAGMHVFSRMAKGLVHPVTAALIASAVFLCSAAVIFMFSGEARLQISEISSGGLMAALLMGVSLSAVNLALFYVYHAGAPLSMAVPLIRVSAAVLGVFAGLLFFAEQLSLVQAFGVGLALTGIVVMSL